MTTTHKTSKTPDKKADKVHKAKSSAKKSAAPKSVAKKTTAASKQAAPGATVTIKQIRSGAGRLPAQIATLKGLGLNKMHRTRTLEDTPSTRGMINAVSHLVEIVEAA